MAKTLENLQIWNTSIDLSVDIYALTSIFPSEERYALMQQLRRSAVSVASNIAEGFGRNSDREFKRFLSISLGSLFELRTQLIVAEKLNYCRLNSELTETIEILGKRIRTLIKRLD